MKCTFALRHGELVAGLREVAHAKKRVPRLKKLLQPYAKNLELLHAFRQIHRERALLFLQPRHMRVAEKRHAVGSKLDQLIDRLRETLRRLVRKTINQIGIDTVESKLTRRSKQLARHFKRLNPMNRLLHLELKILNPHAEPVETHAP